VQNYSTGFLPVGPDYSVGRSGSQYFQVKFVQPQITSFNMTISGRIAGCWVCLVDSQVKVDGKTWVEALTGNGNFGWGDMFQVYSGSGAPTLTSPGTPGCASAVAMNGSTNYSNTTFTCTFGQQGSGAIGTILVRWKLASTQTLTSMTFTV
jgi:hypothetical protein